MAKSVVVIEDDENTLDLIRLNLEQAGIRVITAKDGLSGLEQVRKHRPSGVLVDIKLPRMNGYEVCTALQSDKDLSRIPIMVITGLTDEGPSEDAKWRDRLSVADFMSKPFPPSEMTDRVLKMIAA